ncbi:hypothetical protein EV129_11347 [Rhizobium azibense]|uniref:Uncharacterized protein n=1 Tax=Rhizobium azibense TaxID=1136135 RepID=A0A4R3RHD6_9HYPH|nr:hypothetical protein EV129_11347 [Rhizobium azibense]
MRLMKAIIGLVSTVRELRRKKQEAIRVGCLQDHSSLINIQWVPVAVAFGITIAVTLGIIR